MAIEGIGRIPAQLPDVRPTGPAARPGAASFADALGQALGQVEAAQQEGDAQSAPLAAKVRNKLVEAYQEVMRMPV